MRKNVLKRKRTPVSSAPNSYSRVKSRRSSSVTFSNLFPWLITLFTFSIFIAMLSVALLYAYRFVTVSEYFAVKEVTVVGNVRLGSGEIQAIAGLEPGINSLAVRMGDVEANLLANPWIAEVSVKRELPDSFTVTIRERVPKYWVRQGETLTYADEHGDSICEVMPGKFTSLPFLSVEPGMERWQERLSGMVQALETARLPIDVNNAAWVRLTRSSGVELFLENTDMSLRIGVEDWHANLDRLAKVLEDLSRRGELKRVREVRVTGPAVWVRAEDRNSAES